MNDTHLEDIIEGCKKGKRRSQEMLYQEYSGKMYAVCLYYAGNKTEAEDFLHNGFIKVFDKIKQYRRAGAFDAWMRKIFMHTALEKYRKKKLLFSSAMQEKIQFVESNQEDALSQLSAAEITKLIQQLSPAYRMVFNLYAIEGYSHKEIGILLGISESTSKSNLSRARQILQKKLAKAAEEKQPNGRQMTTSKNSKVIGKTVLLILSFLFINQLFAQQLGVSATYSNSEYEKFQNNFGYEIELNELLKSNNKVGLTFFQSFNEPNYSYTFFSDADGREYYREVDSNNQRFGISINYGLNLLKKRRANIYVGPKVSANYFKINESGIQKRFDENAFYDYSSNYWAYTKIGLGLFLEYDRPLFTNQFFLFAAVEPEIIFYSKFGLIGSSKPAIIGFTNYKFGLKFNLKKKQENE